MRRGNASPIVEPVHILGYEREATLRAPLEQGERAVTRVRLGATNRVPPPVVPFPNQPWVPRESLRRREVLR